MRILFPGIVGPREFFFGLKNGAIPQDKIGERKPSPVGKFPRFAGKVARSAERGASAAEAKGGFERGEKTDEESYFYTRRLIHR